MLQQGSDKKMQDMKNVMGVKKKFLKIKIIKILFYSVIIKEVVQYYIFVLDQYLDIKLHSSRVKGHHVEL